MKKQNFKKAKLLNVLGTLACIVLCGLIFPACDQAAIFYHISIEPPKRDPSIPGSPCNIIYVPDDALYVGTKNSVSIFRNDGSGWKKMDAPGGYLLELATDGTKLYALLYWGSIKDSTHIKIYNPLTKVWSAEILPPANHSMQTLYGADTEIFAGSQYAENNTNKSTILRFNGTGLDDLNISTSLLSGAVKDDVSGLYFLATMGNGVLKYDRLANTVDAAPIAVTGELGITNQNMVGITKTGETDKGGVIAAVSSDNTSRGSVFIYNGGVLNREHTSYNFTGAMSVWYDYKPNDPNPASDLNWKPSLLLLGIRGSENNQGYREILLDTDGSLMTVNPIDLRTPGDKAPSSVNDRAKFNASIGKHPVLSIRQAPWKLFVNSENFIPTFASTTVNGLWVYKYQDNAYQWNAEE